MQKDEEVSAVQRDGIRSVYWKILLCFVGIVASALALVFILFKAFRNATRLLHKAQAAELAASEAQRRNALLATALDNAGDAIEITDSTGRFEYVNPAFERISGYSSAETLGQTPMSLLMNDRNDEPAYREVDAILRSGRVWQGVLTARHKNGQVFQQETTISPVRNAEGAISHFVAVKRDITDDLRARQIWHLAHHDPLTGLPNRTLFSERLEAAIAAVRRRVDRAALLCLDLDHFKEVNDTLGHAAGDELLKVVAARLQGAIREVDTVARMGGDEFAIVQLDVHDPGDVENLCRRLLALLTEPVRIADQDVLISPSIGVAVILEDGSSAAELLQHADIALYRAKAEGRSTFRFFAPEMDLELQERRALEQDLRQALGRGELEVHYQPLVDVASHRVVGVEALMRWHHPTRGTVSPGVFIPIAETTGLILSMGEWLLRTACRQAVAWPDKILAVNLSPVQFRHPNLVGLIGRILDETGLPARRLEVEITEGILLEETEAAVGTLESLRRLGVRIAMDDFGTGYSSLSYLRSFPFDKLKIDQSFVRLLEHDANAMAIVRSVVALGHSLGMVTTAEGVETPAQLAFLREQGCHQAQGFHLARPQPAAALAHLLSGDGAASASDVPAGAGWKIPSTGLELDAPRSIPVGPSTVGAMSGAGAGV
jgi:diguanylate cyclase (GGDEF)-like protein/PAS domain S-box-containing protein